MFLASRAWQGGLRRLNVLASCALVCLMAMNAVADQDGAPEYRIKAAMVFKFLSYTQWPDSAFESAESPFRIWVLGSSPISDELEAIIRGRLVNTRPVSLYEAETAADVTRPHVVFVSRDAERYLAGLSRITRRQPILIVTERDGGFEKSSTINLRLVEGRIGFDVSLPHAGETGLKLSSRLLSVASSVKREEP
ncbi:YfiR family protein [Allohahella marinimesophila]